MSLDTTPLAQSREGFFFMSYISNLGKQEEMQDERNNEMYYGIFNFFPLKNDNYIGVSDGYVRAFL